MTSPFLLHLEGENEPHNVRRYRAVEKMNHLFVVDATLGHSSEAPRSGLIGRTASLVVRTSSEGPRYFHGVVTRVEECAGREARIRIEPRMIRLRHASMWRIFHNLDVISIVAQILGEHLVPMRRRLMELYPPCPHVTQRGETDLDFVRRILGDAGVMFFFDHPRQLSPSAEATSLGTGDIVVLCDRPEGYSHVATSNALRYRASDAEVQPGDDRIVMDLRCEDQMVSAHMMVLQRDFTNPARPVRSEHGERTERVLLQEVIPPFPLVRSGFLYEHDPSYDPPLPLFGELTEEMPLFDQVVEHLPFLNKVSERRLEEHQRRRSVTRAQTPFAHVMPGRTFEIDEAPNALMNDSYLLVETRHAGDAKADHDRAVSMADVVAVSSRVAFRPKRRPRPRILGLESATVVGPGGVGGLLSAIAGSAADAVGTAPTAVVGALATALDGLTSGLAPGDVHSDPHGRIQVRFHWDLEGGGPTAWLRVAHMWAGAGCGSNWLPRIGDEVLVGYLDGDPDRPVVVGSLHNPLSPSVVRYPKDAQQVGFRTRSVPGGAGFHELIFDDRAGAERISMRSSLDVVIESKRDAALLHGGSLRASVAQDRTEFVGRDHASTVAGNRLSDVRGGQQSRVAGNDLMDISGNASRTIRGTQFERVEGPLAHTDIRGSRYSLIGTGKEGGNEIIGVSRDFRVGAGGTVELSAPEGILLRCGTSMIRISQDDIVFVGKRVQLRGTERTEICHGETGAVAMSFDGAVTAQAESVVLASKSGGTLRLDSDAKLNGARVRLNCGDGAPPKPADDRDPNRPADAVFKLDPASFAGTDGTFTLVIGTPSGERVERDVALGGEARVTGRPGDKFFLLGVRKDGASVRAKKGGG